MNSLVEILNHCGESALQFAWPMLWQSSALIAMLFALDFALRNKVRASIRYALWLVVLVKMILPPTVASPTNPRWWIHSSTSPPAKIKTLPIIVTYGDSVAPPDFQLPPVKIPNPPPPHLSSSAFILITSGIVSASLFAWLLIRWRSVAQKIRSAKISNGFDSLLDEVRQLAGSRPEIRLKLTEDSMSPAVCGLFRPTILLPQSLTRNLSREQLRAVLLHEAIHLRRGDVWINCAQALLQIIYWWHPLLWLANARIRRVREEAVDDAVMLALRDESEIYAPTLLEVAKFAFRRPLASLGLVGILESRSALRQRIERLMDFRAPRKTGLTAVSILGILAFTAVAVPMGEAPETTNPETISLQKNSPTLATNDIEKKVESGKLAQDGKLLYEVGRFDEAEIKLKAALVLNPDNQAAFYYLNLVRQARYASKTQGSNPMMVHPVITNILSDANFRVALHALEQRNGVETLAEPDVVTTGGRQVNYLSPNIVHQTSYNPADESDDFSTMTFKITRPTNEDDLKKLLSDAGVKSPTKFFFYAREILIVRGSVEQLALAYGVVLKLNGFSPKEIDEANNRFTKRARLPANPEWDNQLAMRTFKVNAVVFTDALRNNSDLQTTNVSTMAEDFFEKLGVDLEATGKSIAYNDKLGLLFVKATESDLDTVESAIEALNQITPQVHIKARFIEVPKSDVDPNLFTNAVAGPGTGILSDTRFRSVLRKLENESGVETIAEPEVVTTSGKQTQMRATEMENVLTNYALEETSSNSTVVPQIGKFEIGPTVDVVPYVLADGYTIDLTTIVSQLDFLGYDKPRNEHISKFDTQIHLPKVLPGFRSRKAEAVVNLWDNQTLVLGNLKSIFIGFTNGVGVETDAESKFFAEAEKKSPTANKEILVFITATIVDPAGNRVHSDDELSLKLPAVPPQPQQ